MRTNGDGRPAVALDIDGTLGDYHGHFLRFAADWFDRKMPEPTDINPGERLHKFMGVPLARYRDCKLAYRSGGLKRSMPAYPGADDLTRGIRRAGAEVWICTTRPYLRLDNIDPDTREWLRRNGIQYDAVLFGEQKYVELRRQAGWRVVAFAEDLPELFLKARGLLPFARSILRDQPYNQHQSVVGLMGAYRAHDCGDLWDYIAPAVEDWNHDNKRWSRGRAPTRPVARRASGPG